MLNKDKNYQKYGNNKWLNLKSINKKVKNF